MTDAQILAVHIYLHDIDKSAQWYHTRNDGKDIIWRFHGEGQVPAWVSDAYGVWWQAFHTKDWATLAYWLPLKKMGKFATFQKRCDDIERALEIRRTFREIKQDIKAEGSKRNKLRGAETLGELTAFRLRIDPRTVSRAVKRAHKYEEESRNFWLTFLSNAEEYLDEAIPYRHLLRKKNQR